MIRHQKTTKTCLRIQEECGIKDTTDIQHICRYCDRAYVYKYMRDNHSKVCKFRKRLIINHKDKKILKLKNKVKKTKHKARFKTHTNTVRDSQVVEMLKDKLRGRDLHYNMIETPALLAEFTIGLLEDRFYCSNYRHKTFRYGLNHTVDHEALRIKTWFFRAINSKASMAVSKRMRRETTRYNKLSARTDPEDEESLRVLEPATNKISFCRDLKNYIALSAQGSGIIPKNMKRFDNDYTSCLACKARSLKITKHIYDPGYENTPDDPTYTSGSRLDDVFFKTCDCGSNSDASDSND